MNSFTCSTAVITSNQIKRVLETIIYQEHQLHLKVFSQTENLEICTIELILPELIVLLESITQITKLGRQEQEIYK